MGTSAAQSRGSSKAKATADPRWDGIRDRLREHGMRWTPQRRLLIGVLAAADGHVTGSEILDRCRAIDSSTIPSTVYRTLDVLEELGYVSHVHGADGREEYHVLPSRDHGHMYCVTCGKNWELTTDEVAPLASGLKSARGFSVILSHLSVAGVCDNCLEPG